MKSEKTILISINIIRINSGKNADCISFIISSMSFSSSLEVLTSFLPSLLSFYDLERSHHCILQQTKDRLRIALLISSSCHILSKR